MYAYLSYEYHFSYKYHLRMSSIVYINYQIDKDYKHLFYDIRI